MEIFAQQDQSASLQAQGALPSNDTGDAVLERLLHPGRFYRRPDDVLRDESIAASEKRAILSSWASDACAVASCPALRHPPFSDRPVEFDEVMEALASLDRGGDRQPAFDQVGAAPAAVRSPDCTGMGVNR